MSFFSSRSLGNPSSLIAFYEGTGGDYRGRSLSDILQWNASKLEQSHDYIQTVFPLPEGSGVNWDAPIIDRQVFDAFRSRAELREKLRESFQKILWFYGFKLETEDSVFRVSFQALLTFVMLMRDRLSKAITMISMRTTGTHDLTTTTSVSQELSAASVSWVSKMKPWRSTQLSRRTLPASAQDHVNIGAEQLKEA